MLVCRRVFVPSDCFAAAASAVLHSDDSCDDDCLPDNKENNAQVAALCLAVSPNTQGLLRREIAASSFIVTIGALRVDRLGHIAEASDALTALKRDCAGSIGDNKSSSGYLCPVGYR